MHSIILPLFILVPLLLSLFVYSTYISRKCFLISFFNSFFDMSLNIFGNLSTLKCLFIHSFIYFTIYIVINSYIHIRMEILQITTRVDPYDGESTSQASLSSGTHLRLIADVLCFSLV